jgi:hypothetical protein
MRFRYFGLILLALAWSGCRPTDVSSFNSSLLASVASAWTTFNTQSAGTAAWWQEEISLEALNGCALVTQTELASSDPGAAINSVIQGCFGNIPWPGDWTHPDPNAVSFITPLEQSAAYVQLAAATVYAPATAPALQQRLQVKLPKTP